MIYKQNEVFMLYKKHLKRRFTAKHGALRRFTGFYFVFWLFWNSLTNILGIGKQKKGQVF